jgi:hypothetical protein
MDFNELLKLAEKKQHEPILVEKKEVGEWNRKKQVTSLHCFRVLLVELNSFFLQHRVVTILVAYNRAVALTWVRWGKSKSRKNEELGIFFLFLLNLLDHEINHIKKYRKILNSDVTTYAPVRDDVTNLWALSLERQIKIEFSTFKVTFSEFWLRNWIFHIFLRRNRPFNHNFYPNTTAPLMFFFFSNSLFQRKRSATKSPSVSCRRRRGENTRPMWRERED